MQFLPTPSHGGRRYGVHKIDKATNFYPRPHMEGDRARVKLRMSARHFYPRPHMEGDDTVSPPDQLKAAISTHALTWRATRSAAFFDNCQLYFYPRPHMEGDASHGIDFPFVVHFYPRPHMEGDFPVRLRLLLW